MQSRVLWLSLLIIWAATILILSVLPNEQLPSASWFDDLPIDKIAHFLVYWLLTILLIIVFLRKGKKIGPVYTKSLLLSILYGVALECVQLLMLEDRSFEFLDLITNISGSYLGYLTFKYLIRKRIKHEWI